MTKSHDQRKGQWLYNKIYLELQRDGWAHDGRVSNVLFNMSNDDFDKLMSDYND